MATHAPLYLGAEDALTIGTAVAAQRGLHPPRPTLADYRAHVDKLLAQGLGNLYVVRGYMLHPDADPEILLTSKKCVIDDPDGDLVRLFEYAAQRGVYTMAIYTGMTAPVVAALRRRGRWSRDWPRECARPGALASRTSRARARTSSSSTAWKPAWPSLTVPPVDVHWSLVRGAVVGLPSGPRRIRLEPAAIMRVGWE